MTLLELLKADAARQLHFGGTPDATVGTARLLRMILSPRFAPVVTCRLAHWCAAHHLRPLGKLFSMLNFVIFGLEIGLECQIGPGLYFPHTSGTVVGASRIGANVVIYHNVTLGAKTPDLVFDGRLRPTVGDDVFLGSGSKVLGGIHIGDGAVVAANAVVLKDVPPHCVVGGVPAKILEDRSVQASGDQA
jgi:serine O-acetyltransferase